MVALLAISGRLRCLTRFLDLCLYTSFLLRGRRFIGATLLRLNEGVVLMIVNAMNALLLEVDGNARALGTLDAGRFRRFVRIFLDLTERSRRRDNASVGTQRALASNLRRFSNFLLTRITVRSIRRVITSVLRNSIGVLACI